MAASGEFPNSPVLSHVTWPAIDWLCSPPLALNTLDILKKGTTPLAQRACAASRILEAQVGMNPRIIVQRDDAFVLWNEIEFKETDANGKDTVNHLVSTIMEDHLNGFARRSVAPNGRLITLRSQMPRPTRLIDLLCPSRHHRTNDIVGQWTKMASVM